MASVNGGAAHEVVDDEDSSDDVHSNVLYLDDGDANAAAVKVDTETASEADIEADKKRLRRVERARRVVVLRPIMDTMVRMKMRSVMRCLLLLLSVEFCCCWCSRHICWNPCPCLFVDRDFTVCPSTGDSPNQSVRRWFDGTPKW